MAVVEYPDGTQKELPLEMAQEEVQRSYSTPGPVTTTPSEDFTRRELPAPDNYTAAPDITEHAINRANTAEITMPPDVTEYAIRRTTPPEPEMTFSPEESVLPPREQPAAVSAASPYVSPVANAQVTPRGAYGVPRDGGARTHQGVDFAGKRGDPVLAVLPGRVSRVGNTVGDSGAGGQRVEVDHGNGLKSSYMHLDGFNVKENEEVTAGHPVGTVGNTGTKSSGPHLHAKFLVDDKPVDEATFKAAAEARGTAVPGGLTSSSQASGAPAGGLSTSGSSVSYSGQSGATAPITDPSQVNTGLPAVPTPEGYLGELQKVHEQRAQAADLALQANLGQIGVQQQAAANMQQQMVREQAMHADASAHADQERAKYEANIQQAMSQVARVDPGRVWKNAGGFGSAMGIASAAVGGWLQVMHGGQNHALEAINQTIRQDIQAQEVDIATQREGVYRAERAGERQERNIQDRFRRLEEGKLMRLQGIMEQTKADMLLYESPIMQAKHVEFLAGLQKEYLDTFKGLSDEQYKRTFDTRIAELRNADMQEHNRLAREQFSYSQSVSERQLGAAAGAANAENQPVLSEPGTQREIFVDPRVPVAKEHYSKLIERQRVRRDLGQKIKDYHGLVKRIGRKFGGWGSNTRFLGSDDQKLLKSAYQDVQSSLTKKQTGAAMNETEITLYSDMIGEPPSWTGIDPSTRLQRLLLTLHDDENTDFDQVRSKNADGSIYRGGSWYLKLPDDGKPTNTTINALRGHDKPNTGLQSEDPFEVLGAINTLTDLQDVPSEKAALQKNFPDLFEEVDTARLRAASEAKAAGDTRLAEQILRSYEGFANKWMKIDKTRGLDPKDTSPSGMSHQHAPGQLVFPGPAAGYYNE